MGQCNAGMDCSSRIEFSPGEDFRPRASHDYMTILFRFPHSSVSCYQVLSGTPTSALTATSLHIGAEMRDSVAGLPHRRSTGRGKREDGKEMAVAYQVLGP